MQIGDVVKLCPSKTRWAPDESWVQRKKSGIVVGIVHHEILNASVYEVMWNDGRIFRQYLSDLAAIKS